MIGIFDSGFGWLQTLQYFQEAYPHYDYLFLADQKNYPFGTKTPKQVKEYTFQWLQRLFDQWAQIVIVACNTAAAYAIRERQTIYPDKKTLSITIPGMEKITEIQKTCKNIAVRATQWTMQSGMYTKLFEKVDKIKNINMQVTVTTELVDLVERGETDITKKQKIIEKYTKLLEQDKIDCLVLWCTHFPVLLPEIMTQFDGTIINPWYEAVIKIQPYLERHPEIREKLTTNGITKLYTTGDPDNFIAIWKNIFPNLEEAHKVII